jgi:hypothetical protein
MRKDAVATGNPDMAHATMARMPLHRRVFFIAGFDPKSPRYYHHLIRALAAHRPAGAEAPAVQVGPRRRLNDIADEWDLHCPQADGTPLHTRFTLLRWDDIVREHWQRPALAVLRDHWNFYVRGRHGPLAAAWAGTRLNWLFLMFPLLVGLLVLFGWLALCFTLGALWPRPVEPLMAVLAAMASAPAAWWAWRRLSHRVGSDWLMRLYGFSYQQAAGRVPALAGRADAMAALVRQSFDGPHAPREVLLVGHSTGATLAADALARALAQDPELGTGPTALGLLTLGHCTPLVYRFAHAGVLRAQLDTLTAHAPLAWVDYTAPADWAGCGRLPPWPRPGPALLKRLSPRFPKILSPARYAALRRDRLAMHMQYLKPADLPGRYDLLSITAGERTLRERHAALRDDYPTP